MVFGIYIEKHKKSLNCFLMFASQLSPGSTEPLGVLVLKSRGIFADAGWYWIGVAALAAFTILFNFFYTIALTYLKRKYQASKIF